jgi:hypothetical protein
LLAKLAKLLLVNPFGLGDWRSLGEGFLNEKVIGGLFSFFLGKN